MGSELMKMDPAAVPAYIREAFGLDKNDGLVTTGDSFPVISLKGRRFRLRVPDHDEQALPDGTELPVVILGYDPDKGCAKTYYEADYDPDANDPPDCSSSDGFTPDEWVGVPQAEKCALCPHNAWGSGKTGRGKKCADQKRLIVCAPGQLLTEDETILFVLRVPPASLKALSGYARELTQYNVPVHCAKTVLSMADADYPQIDLRFGGFLDEDEMAAAIGLVDKEVAELKAMIHRAAAVRTETEDAPVEPQAAPEKEELVEPAPVDPPKKKRAPRKKKVVEPVVEEEEVADPVADVEGTGKMDDILKNWA